MTNPTRRRFFSNAAAFLAASLVSGSASAHSKKRRRKTIFHMYRWSGHGRRASQAALSHAANRRYLTIGAALRDLPHRRSRLHLVRLDASLGDLIRLFIVRRRLWVDLRHVA